MDLVKAYGNLNQWNTYHLGYPFHLSEIWGHRKCSRNGYFWAICMGIAILPRRDFGRVQFCRGGGRGHGILVGCHPWVKHIHTGFSLWTQWQSLTLTKIQNPRKEKKHLKTGRIQVEHGGGVEKCESQFIAIYFCNFSQFFYPCFFYRLGHCFWVHFFPTWVRFYFHVFVEWMSVRKILLLIP